MIKKIKNIFSASENSNPVREGENPIISNVSFDIEGMSCDHCATSIAGRFEGKNGIISKAVSYPDGKGHFIYDSEIINEGDIASIINSGNYRAKNVIDENSTLERASKGQYDLIIIGGGSAAFSACSTAAELGLSVLMVNAGLDIGGTCVNIGCVPSKFLIRNAEQIYRGSHSPFEGVSNAVSVSKYQTIIKQKRKLVEELRSKKYIDVVGRLDSVEVLKGWAKFIDDKTIEVNGKQYKGLKFLLATGATTNIPDIDGLKETGYFTNETIFETEDLPEHLIVLGAGYIALEIAQAYRRFGSKVTILHRSDRILRAQQEDITYELAKQLINEGINIHTNVNIKNFKKVDNRITASTNVGEFDATHILVATGVKSNTSGMAIEKTGVELDDKGRIRVNRKQETNIAHIYAAGDCTNTPAFVYTAAKEGKVAVLNAFRSTGDMVDYKSMPWVVFTDPQVAGAGMDELGAERAGIPYEISVVPLAEVPRAVVALDTRGFIKLLRNTVNDKIIGGRIVAPEGGELSMQLSLAIKAGMTSKELAESFHPYLTLSEGIKLAAITFDKDIAELSCCAS